MKQTREEKHCIECVHGGGPYRSLSDEICGRNVKPAGVDRVLGCHSYMAERLLLCRSERADWSWFERYVWQGDRCGPDGRWYEFTKPCERPPPSSRNE